MAIKRRSFRIKKRIIAVLTAKNVKNVIRDYFKFKSKDVAKYNQTRISLQTKKIDGSSPHK